MRNLNPPPAELYLMRHAHSGWPQPGERDFDRTLDARGVAEAEAVARMVVSSGYKPQLILCSAAVRCRQTAESFHSITGEGPEIRFIEDFYNAPFETYLAAIEAETCQTLMIIGHNPSIEVLLEALIGSERTASTIPTGFPTAGFAALARADQTQSPPHWQLQTFLCP